MANPADKLAPNAFTVAKNDKGRWVAFNAQGQATANFRTKAQAQNHAKAIKKVYEIVHGGPIRKLAQKTKEKLADSAFGNVARIVAGEETKAGLSGSLGIGAKQQMLGEAARPAAKAVAAPQAAEKPLTASEFKKLLKGRRLPAVRPLAGLAPKAAAAAPNLIQAAAQAAPAKPQRERRKKAAAAARGVQYGERAGGFVLEDAGAGLTAHDLTRMLAQRHSPAEAAEPPPAMRGPKASKASVAAAAARTPRNLPAQAAAPPAQAGETPQGRLPAPTGKINLQLASKSTAPYEGPIAPPPMPKLTPTRPGERWSRPVRPSRVAEATSRAMGGKVSPIIQQAPKIDLGSPAAARGATAAHQAGGMASRSLPGMLFKLFGRLDELIRLLLRNREKQRDDQDSQRHHRRLRRPPEEPKARGNPTRAAGKGGEKGRFSFARMVTRFSGLGGGKPSAGGAARVPGSMAERAAGMASGGLMEGAGLAGGVALGVAGAAAGIGAVAVKLAEAPHIIEGFTSGLLEGQRDLRRFNASIAVSFATLERQEIQLSARTGRATAGTTRTLTKSQMALREALQPQREVLANIKNEVGSMANQMGTGLAEAINELFLIREIAEWWRGKGGAAGQNVLPPFRFMDAVAQGRWTAPKNPLPQNPPPGGVNRNPAPLPPGWPQP